MDGESSERGRPLAGYTQIVVAVAGILIATSITSCAALLISVLQHQSAQHEQIEALRASDLRTKEHLGRLWERTKLLSTREQQLQDRAATDHNWEVIQRLDTRLHTVEHTLWPPTRPGGD